MIVTTPRRLRGMDAENRIWFLVLDHRSALSKTTGAYKLKTIMKYKEMKILSKCNRCQL